MGEGDVGLAEDDVGAFRLKQRDSPSLIANHLLALVEDELEHLYHRFAGSLLDQLVHE